MDTPDSLLAELEHGLDTTEYITRLKRVQVPKEYQFLLVVLSEAHDPAEIQRIKNQFDSALASDTLGSVVLNFPVQMSVVKTSAIQEIKVQPFKHVGRHPPRVNRDHGGLNIAGDPDPLAPDGP